MHTVDVVFKSAILVHILFIYSTLLGIINETASNRFLHIICKNTVCLCVWKTGKL